MENLFKCNGRRFRAKINGAECVGRIRVEYGRVFLDGKDKLGFNYYWGVGDGCEYSLSANNVTDLQLLGMTATEIDAYKDWQVGDKVSRPDVDGPDVMEVILRNDKVVICEDAEERAAVFTCNELYNEGYRLVADPEPDDDTVELTLDQIADKFGIETDKLRIKKR